jgi:hypothetical protein
MTEDIETYLGQVVSFDYERSFGFVEDENERSYYFRFDKKEQYQNKKDGLIPRIHKFCSGDEVEFNLRTSWKDDTKLEATI